MAAPMDAGKILLLLVLASIDIQPCTSQVPDLDERLIDNVKKDMWLVEFYAPWCGHCKKLEPIFFQVYFALKDSDVHVGKLDCTRYSSVASEFDVRGFPTIKFFNGDKTYTHRGERTREDILEFVNKARGPAVRFLPSRGRFDEVQSRHKDSAFFVYIGDADKAEQLFEIYSSIAETRAIQSYFYAGKANILSQGTQVRRTPTVIVFKDKTFYEFEGESPAVLKSELDDWINHERYPTFPLISGSNVNEIAEIGKLLVMAIVDLTTEDTLETNKRVKDMMEKLAFKRSTFHKDFQFLYMTDTETANSITMSFLSTPVLIVLDPNTHYYYMPEKAFNSLSPEEVTQFVNKVKDGQINPLGGTGFLMRLKRLFYDIVLMFVGVWSSSRWLFLLMFGLPTAVISIVCYSLCCMDTVDDEMPDSEDEEDDDNGQRSSIEQQPAVKGHEKAE